MTTVVSIIAGILIFSFLVISHEFGHFLMARLTGTAVIEFSVGMGPTIFHKQGKRTRFSLKAIPFGGSCRMLGEDAAGGGEIDAKAITDAFEDEENPDSHEDTEGSKTAKPAGEPAEGSDDPEEDDPYTYYGVKYEPTDSFNEKSVWARMLMVVGGPLFNMIFAMIVGIIMVITSGTNPAVVYNVYEGYEAEAAGIQTGDRILELDGHGISVGREIALLLNVDGLGDVVTVTYERDGEEYTVTYSTNYEAYKLGISYMSDDTPAAVSEITEDSAAGQAGLQDGDIITAVDGTAIATGAQLNQYFDEHEIDGSPLQVAYTRDGAVCEAEITPQLTTGKTLGFAASYYGEKATLVSAISYGFREVIYGVKCVIYSLEMMFNGQVGFEDISGPVGIVSVISSTVTEDAQYGTLVVMSDLLCLTVLLSVNLGLVNMFPFPALDGGRFLLLLVEAVIRRKLPPKVENAVNMVGFVILMGFMVVVLVSDVIKLF